jgi:methylated-DNA-protein-cysteine methyltransferase-like protein
VEPIMTDPRHARIIARIRAIPEGFVQSYGDIDPRAPRLVGQVLAAYRGDDLPWHRVVRADGTLAKGQRQRALLSREGVPLRGQRVDMRRGRLPRELLP